MFDPVRWGLPLGGLARLPHDLEAFWRRYQPCFRTQTRDPSAQALTFWRGQLTMEDQRNFANIERRVAGGDGQALHHFMSESPWVAQAVFRQIQTDIRHHPALPRGGVVILDESADAKAGPHSAGAARQRNGRLGKLALSQVATTLVYYHPSAQVWTLVDAELFLPEQWFTPAQATLRAQAGIPPERSFATKSQLGLRMLERVQAQGLPFQYVACDEFYGRSRAFRRQLAAWGLLYAAEIRAKTRVALEPPTPHVPHPPLLLAGQLVHHPSTAWQPTVVRPSERGVLHADFAVRRVWTVTETQEFTPEWLVIRREANGRLSYTLLNGPEDAAASDLIQRSCWRFFTERTYQDAKAELGWDDFQARKYRAWEHELALTAAATWFIAEVKLNWQAEYPRDPSLQQQFELQVLPLLSTANVRDLLAAALPLPQLTPDLSQQLVTAHLVHRARSTRSRLKSRRPKHDSS